MADLDTLYDVRAVLRRYPEGVVIALFPDESADNRGHVLCYAMPPTSAEYELLKRELESIGYRVEVRGGERLVPRG